MFRKRKDSDFSAEVEAHIRLEADRYRERGMNEADALAAARRAFGNVPSSQERFYESRRMLWWDALWQDVRLGVRLLAKTPGWTIVAALTAALGIGAAAAIFSIVNTVLLRPLPFSHAEQLYSVSEVLAFGNLAGLAPDYFTMRENLHGNYGSSIQEMAAYDMEGVNWTAADRAERLTAGEVTASFLGTLQIQPILGRPFRPEEGRPDAERTVLLSYGLWQRRFGADPKIVGQEIRLDRNPALVIGVMPRSFDFPQGSDVWIPLALDEEQQRRGQMTRIVNIVARASGAGPQASRQVNQELDALAQAVRNESTRHGFKPTSRITAVPLQETLTGDMRPALLVFSGAVGLMLLIVCFTVANLMLARATARRREIAVRVALGAPRRRIVSQLLTESLIVSLLGGGLGLGFAAAALAAINSSRRVVLEGLPEVSIDMTTAAFTLLVTVLTGVIFGVAPAMGALGFGVRDALEGESRGGGTRASLRRMRQALVVAQLGVSLTLLIGAGLLAKSFYRLRTTNPGFRPENVLTARINLAGPSYASLERQREFVQELLERVSRSGSVEAASIGALPTVISGMFGIIRIEHFSPDAQGQAPLAAQMVVSPDYFRVLGAPLLQGRGLEAGDTRERRLVVVVNQAFARKYFPGESALGHRIAENLPNPDWFEIVGVVGDVRQSGLDQDVTPTVYSNFLQVQAAFPVLARVNLLIRASRDALGLVPSVERIVAGMDRDEPLFNVKTMEQRLSDSIGSRRFDAAITGAFALIAAFLAAIGVYGVMSYLVTLRTPEIGIRLALGARRGRVFGAILREGMLLTLTGGALGIAGAIALSRYLATLLYGVSTRDLSIFIGAVLALFAAAIAACAIPGQRAASVDPATALRHN